MRIVDPETGKSYVEKRRVRLNEPGQSRALTFSCYRHDAFLGRDRTRAWFCEALEEARKKFAYELWAYVVMPEHVHVLVYPGDTPERMSSFLQAVKEPVARKAIPYRPLVLAWRCGLAAFQQFRRKGREPAALSKDE